MDTYGYVEDYMTRIDFFESADTAGDEGSFEYGGGSNFISTHNCTRRELETKFNKLAESNKKLIE